MVELATDQREWGERGGGVGVGRRCAQEETGTGAVGGRRRTRSHDKERNKPILVRLESSSKARREAYPQTTSL